MKHMLLSQTMYYNLVWEYGNLLYMNYLGNKKFFVLHMFVTDLYPRLHNLLNQK